MVAGEGREGSGCEYKGVAWGDLRGDGKVLYLYGGAGYPYVHVLARESFLEGVMIPKQSFMDQHTQA